MYLYHGAPLQNLQGILLDGGFDPTKIGTGWGTTYGKGVYLTPAIEVARVYSDSYRVLKVTIPDLKTYQLTRTFKPSHRRDQLKLEQLKADLSRKGINCLISPDGEEYVVFDSTVYCNLPGISIIYNFQTDSSVQAEHKACSNTL